MEEIYANIEYDNHVDSKPSQNQTGPRSSERIFHGAVVLCLGLLSVFLLAGLIGLCVYHRDSVRDSSAELSTVKANLTKRLQNSENKLSSVTEERDRLNASLSNTTKELDRLQSLSKQKKTCPAGWRMFSCTCYLLSTKSETWGKGREDCKGRGADLVVINSYEEQEFLTKVINQDTWIGLNDKENEGTWKWTDGTPLTLSYWFTRQPDNGAGDPRWGEEDCAHIQASTKTGGNWNDLRCDNSLKWICERFA
ncbi:C-type lectin domain family 4 member E-like [Micropterus salmoides]|uniref:C-type lectin domain family 4 member E-like n=1 Tax=Micropterus salmoides TaxID=27706 RepID=UPI0018EC81C4|nr:C-type lectin domain family 4 member E-like [Micropterus salmoides]